MSIRITHIRNMFLWLDPVGIIVRYAEKMNFGRIKRQFLRKHGGAV